MRFCSWIRSGSFFLLIQIKEEKNATGSRSEPKLKEKKGGGLLRTRQTDVSPLSSSISRSPPHLAPSIFLKSCPIFALPREDVKRTKTFTFNQQKRLFIRFLLYKLPANQVHSSSNDLLCCKFICHLVFVFMRQILIRILTGAAWWVLQTRFFLSF